MRGGTCSLQRGGRLLRHEQDGTLTVERSAFDMLMTTLPWSLSPIRPPWMSGTLTVVWGMTAEPSEPPLAAQPG
ncbi:MAG: contractile injection system tape measure protein [Pseudomonadota bacterium]